MPHSRRPSALIQTEAASRRLVKSMHKQWASSALMHEPCACVSARTKYREAIRKLPPACRKAVAAICVNATEGSPWNGWQSVSSSGDMS
jgi:hypothetical protein